MFPLMTRTIGSQTVNRLPSRLHSVRHYHRLPRLRMGVKLGWLTQYYKKNLTILSPTEFEKVRPLSSIWGLWRGRTNPAIEIAPVKPSQADLLRSTKNAVDTLKKTGKPEHSIAVIDDKGHAYSTVIFAGKFKDDELPFLSGADDWSTPNQLICAFAPSGRHLPKKWATRVDTLPNYEHGVLELEPVVSGQPDELEIEEFQHSLVEKNSFDGLVALGSSTIERSHFDSAEDERVRVWSYIATTHRFDHVLDGYAEHRPVLDKSDSSLYFVANGEGQHAWRSVDGANNPIALFVFSVMARSFFRYIQLQAKRKRENLPPLDIVRYRAEALRELRRYIATVDPQLAKDRRRAAVLDFLGRWIPLVRLIFGANVVQAPPEFTLPGDSTKTATGTGSGSGGTGGDSGSEGTVSQTGPADQSDSFSLWPFLLIVVLLAIDDDDDEDDEEDLDSFFVDLDKESTT